MHTPSTSLTRWLTGALVVCALFAGVLLDIDLPGVYMDAVNPDYLAAPILHPGRRIDVWALPGNLIMGRFPVLTSLYHGTGQLWLGLPFFALFGTSVTSLRIVHGLCACAILVCATLFLRRAGLREAAIAAAGVALAVDPSFVFAFRTQSYITLTPCAWLLVSLLALGRAGAAPDPRRWLVCSGAAYGLAFFGYFIYLFYLPAMLYAVLAWPAPRAAGTPRWRRLPPWAIGLCIGAVGYFAGYALLTLSLGGPRGLVAYLRDTQQQLGVMNSSLDLAGRVAWAWHMLKSVTHNWWQYSMLFGNQESVPGAQAKTLLLTAAPIALWLAAEARRTAGIHLRATIACGISFFLVSLVFGNRLGGHHYVSLLVLGYVGLALGVAALVAKRADAAPFARSGWVLVPMIALLVLNLQGETEIRARLRETGGTGLMSEAVNRFAADARRERAADFYYFPDWGLALPFAFLTGAQVEFGSVPEAKRVRELLCQGRNVSVAAITGDRARRFADWTREFGWADPVVAPYRQRDGTVVFDVATWTGDPPASVSERCRPR